MNALWVATLLEASAPQPLTVAVVPVGGTIANEHVVRATQALADTLRGYEGLAVVSLAQPETVLGRDAASQLADCADDACRVRVTSVLRVERLVVSEVIAGGAVRLRLVATSSSAPAVVRVSRESPPGDLARLRGTLAAAARELFPDLPENGALIVKSDTGGAEVWLDGQPLGPAPVGPVRVRAGAHGLEVRAKGHFPHREQVAIALGQTAVVQADLTKNRGSLPWYLGAGAAGAAAIGLVLGVTAQSTAHGWEDACADRTCDPGFTRARYEDDTASVGARRTIANGLFVAAGALLIGGVVAWAIDPGSDVVEGAAP